MQLESASGFRRSLKFGAILLTSMILLGMDAYQLRYDSAVPTVVWLALAMTAALSVAWIVRGPRARAAVYAAVITLFIGHRALTLPQAGSLSGCPAVIAPAAQALFSSSAVPAELRAESLSASKVICLSGRFTRLLEGDAVGLQPMERFARFHTLLLSVAARSQLTAEAQLALWRAFSEPARGSERLPAASQAALALDDSPGSSSLLRMAALADILEESDRRGSSLEPDEQRLSRAVHDFFDRSFTENPRTLENLRRLLVNAEDGDLPREWLEPIAHRLLVWERVASAHHARLPGS